MPLPILMFMWGGLCNVPVGRHPGNRHTHDLGIETGSPLEVLGEDGYVVYATGRRVKDVTGVNHCP